MKKKTIIAINITLVVVLIGFVAFEWKGIKKSVPERCAEKRGKTLKSANPAYGVVVIDEEEPQGEFEKTFVDYPREDVGGNICRAWRSVPKEVVDDTTRELDNAITALNMARQSNPDDKRVEHKLKISNMVKKLVNSGFNVDKMVSGEKR